MKKGKRQENLPMSLTISRVTTVHCGFDEGDYIKITIEDKNSAMSFVIIKVSCEEFAKALTGLGCVDCKGDVAGLNKIGKKHEHKTLVFEIPESVYKNSKFRKEKTVEIIKKECPKGWVPDESFNNQNSFSQHKDKYYARTTIRRWV